MSKDGMNYAPEARSELVVKPGEFVFSAIGFDHGHIYGMCGSLAAAGGTFKSAYDPDPSKIEPLKKKFPNLIIAKSEQEILDDKEVHMVAAAAVPSERCPLGIRVMDAGKDYFTDKAPLISLPQLEAAKAAVKRTGKKYMVCYSERLQSECGMMAGDLIAAGEIGKVLQVIGLGPHRLNAPSRPEWFFQKEKYGGILIDIGSHQAEQFLYYTGATDAQVVFAHADNLNHAAYPELEDFGEASLLGNNGASNYFRVDWFTPDGLGTWGDGRTIILGTEGYIEMRKYINVGADPNPGHLFLVNGKQETYINATGKVGFPFFGQLITDCLNRTEKAMTQEHAFKAAELSIRAQLAATKMK